MPKKWKMPEWMEKYVPLIHNTGGNDVTEMVNGNANPLVNLPLSTLQACVKSQVGLLESLHAKGIIAMLVLGFMASLLSGCLMVRVPSPVAPCPPFAPCAISHQQPVHGHVALPHRQRTGFEVKIPLIRF